MVIVPQFDNAYEFLANGLAAVDKNGQQGYINEKGDMVMGPPFDSVTLFPAHRIAKVRLNDKWGLISDKGQIITKPSLDFIGTFSDNGLAPIRQAGKFGFINAKGQIVIEPQFDGAHIFSAHGVAWVKQGQNRGYINEQGEWVLKAIENCGELTVTHLGKVVFKESNPVLLFRENLLCTNRTKVREAIKKSGGKVKKEDSQKWGDTYYSSALLKGSSELYVSYSVNDQKFVLAQYTFPSSMDTQQIVRIKNMVESKYGKTDYQSGKTSLGKVSFLWNLNSDISLEVSRGWPNTTTYLTYKHNKNYREQRAEMERQKEVREQQQVNSQTNNF